jgi:hypothetical protein
VHIHRYTHLLYLFRFFMSLVTRLFFSFSFCDLSLDISGVAGEYQTKWAGTLGLECGITSLMVGWGMCISNGVIDGGEGVMMMDEV